MSASANNRGFTLVEVLVAFVILVTMAGTLLRFISDGLQATGRGEDEVMLAAVVEDTLAQVGSDIPFASGDRKLVPSKGYQALLTMEPVTADLRGGLPTFPVWDVDLTVWRDGSEPSRGITISTVILAPAGQ